MESNKDIFKFKQFEICQNKTAMKVGTDGVLLGAWVNIDNAKKILDIGTGTGLIAIMIAQRNNLAEIDAVEIDNDAYNQAVENFQNCIWKDRIIAYNIDFVKFSKLCKNKYDLIVSNPPFFENSVLPTSVKRQTARHTTELSYDLLIENSSELLNDTGIFSIIIPENIHKEIIHKSTKYFLYCFQKTYIKHTKEKPAKRVLLSFSKQINTLEESILVIKEHDNFSKKYYDLTKDFYCVF